LQKNIAAGVVAGALVIGGVGTALILPRMAEAADPTPSPAASSSTTTVPVAPGGSTGTGIAGDHRGHGGPGGLDADDLTAAAKALGMTEADLTTALNGGKSAADVAKDKGVDVQKVIDAIVASDKAEFAAAVTAGTMTQAQADQLLANLTTHVTDEVNGVAGGPGGHGGHGGPGGQAPSSGTSGSGTSG
jgi:hypothetical protein